MIVRIARSRRTSARSLRLSVVLPLCLLSISPGPPLDRPPVDRFTLSNGLDVVLAPDRSTQVVAVNVWYRAGSSEEPASKAGVARLFERLMFAGSTNVPAGGHARLLEQTGGRVGAEVEEDVARFTQTLPSNRLRQALWLEADRMRGVVINDTTFGNARLGLLEDLQESAGAEPFTGPIMEAVVALYDSTACPGYSHPPTGRVGSIRALTLDDAGRFFSDHYRPNRARLVVTGDFDPIPTRELITQYFGGIARGPDVRPLPCDGRVTPGQIRRDVTGRTAGQVGAGLFYRVPPHNHADTPAIELLGVILGQGSGSRLSLVLGTELGLAGATQAGVLTTRVGPGAFALFAVAKPSVPADSLIALLGRQAAWAASNDMGEAELSRAKNIYRATLVSGSERPHDQAEALHHAVMYHDSLEAAGAELDRVQLVTLADVRRVAASWLKPENSLRLVISPGAGS